MSQPRNVLVVAAHPDDEVLGCGGTIARHVAEGDVVDVVFMADGETSRQNANIERRRACANAAGKALGVHRMVFLSGPDQRLDIRPLLSIIRLIEDLKDFPDIIYTHHAGDLNMDHRIVHQAVMTAFRPLPDARYTAIYTFEVPSSTEWGSGFEPDHFVDISAFTDKKKDALDAYGEEMPNNQCHARSFSALYHLNELRGRQCGIRCAEAFMTMRTIWR